jgi:hypothetical protein
MKFLLTVGHFGKKIEYGILVAAGIKGLVRVAICGQHPPLSFGTSFIINIIALHPFILE